METTTLPIGFELKAVTGRTIEGYAAAWARDRVNDIIDPKAFNRTVAENPDVSIFVGHDSTKLPVGHPIEMRADSHGLFTKSHIYDTPDGNALLTVAKERLAKGRTLGMSIGFRTVKDHWDAKQKARILEDVDLIEYSFLASPLLAANPQAFALGVKSLNGELEPVPDELQGQVRALVDEYKSQQRTDVSADSAVVQAAKGGPLMDLADIAFAYIDAGGVLDEERKTVPRASRHLAHHDEAGALDLQAVRDFLNSTGAKDSPGLAHMLGHAAGAGLLGYKSIRDCAHDPDWEHSVAAKVLIQNFKGFLLAEASIAEHDAMRHLKQDTKGGERIGKTLLPEYVAQQDRWTQMVQKAREINQGVDGSAVVDLYRTQFELLDLEEVA